MPVSATTLFHYTSRLENIISILENEFIPHYSLEDYKYLFGHDASNFYVPMVCFCDIPLSVINDHVQMYGEYAIGLKRSWGIENGLNPINYVVNASQYTKNLQELFLGSLTFWFGFYDKYEKKSDEGFAYSIINGFINNMVYSKPFEGLGKNKNKIIFYNEREWRYIPLTKKDKLDKEYSLFIKPNEPNLAELIEQNTKNQENRKLQFDPEDIQFLIVKSETERITLAREVERIKSQKYNSDDIDLLKTKIISLETIRNNI